MRSPDSAMPAFRHQVHHLRAPEEFGLAVSGASLVADFIAPQALPTRVEQFQSPGWSLDLHQAHVKARVHAELPPGWASLGLMRGSSPSSWYGIEAKPGTLVCNPPGVPIDGCFSPGFTCLAVGVPAEVWNRCRELAGVGGFSFDRLTTHQLPAPLYARVQRKLTATLELLYRVESEPLLADFAAREAADFVTDTVTMAWELSAPGVSCRDWPCNRGRVARAAEAWMRAHLAEPIHVTDVCLALRVSRREIEYAFRSVFDQSPRDYLQKLRLNAVRRALQRGDGARDAVTRAALDHGITHLGRFSAHYRALFGESPSATRRSRAVAGGT